jgi:hypothetical protein
MLNSRAELDALKKKAFAEITVWKKESCLRGTGCVANGFLKSF